MSPTAPPLALTPSGLADHWQAYAESMQELGRPDDARPAYRTAGLLRAIEGGPRIAALRDVAQMVETLTPSCVIGTTSVFAEFYDAGWRSAIDEVLEALSALAIEEGHDVGGGS